MRTIQELQKNGYLCMEILENRKIRIDETKFFRILIGVAVGSGEPPRSYATTWYHENIEDLHVCIYVSETLKYQENNILESLEKKLDLCKNEKDLLTLDGETI